MWVEFHGHNRRLRVLLGDDASLASRRRATIQNALATTQQQRDQLRTFILNHQPPLAKSSGARDVSADNCVRIFEQLAGFESHIFGWQLFNQFCIRADERVGRFLVIAANSRSDLVVVSLSPSFKKPSGMSTDSIVTAG